MVRSERSPAGTTPFLEHDQRSRNPLIELLLVLLTRVHLRDTEVRSADLASGPQLFGCLRGDRLAPLLLRMAMSSDSTSSKAMLRALLALSSLHISKDDRAFAYQAKAISLLNVSLTQSQDSAVAFQNVASSMLLCTFEVCALPKLRIAERAEHALGTPSFERLHELGYSPLWCQADRHT